MFHAEKLVRELLESAGWRAVNKLRGQMNLTEAQASCIRRAVSDIKLHELDKINGLVGAVQRECLVDRYVATAGDRAL